MAAASEEFVCKPDVRADALDFTDAACFWKGRVALYAILRALGIEPGDAVIVPGYTCVVVPSAVYFLGAKPLYAEIDPATYNVTLPTIERAAAQEPVRAIVVQHTYGLPADVAPICRWAAERGIAVIEDCCHALGSAARDASQPDSSWQPVGTWGDAAFFSSQWSKPIVTGLGGWAVARSATVRNRLHELAEREAVRPSRRESAQLAAQFALYKLLFRPALYWPAQAALRTLAQRGWAIGSSRTDELELQFPHDYLKRMAPWQERKMRSAARRIESYVAQRAAVRELYEQALTAAGWPILPALDYAQPALLRYPVRVANKAELLQIARRERVELGDWFDHPLHPRGLNLAPLGWRDGMCPEAERAADEVVNLPMHARVKPRDVARAVQLLVEHGVQPR